jgi:hypothetical protein
MLIQTPYKKFAEQFTSTVNGKDFTNDKIKIFQLQTGGGKSFFQDKEMPIVLLEKEQEIELIARARTGTGKEHAKYVPGLFYYRYLPKISISKEGEKHSELAELYPEVFEFNDKNYTLKGFATPYWNGDCKTPVEGSDFEDRESGDNYEDYDGLGLTTSYTPTSFDSISELIDFLNNEFPKLLIDPIKKLIHYYYNMYM